MTTPLSVFSCLQVVNFYDRLTSGFYKFFIIFQFPVNNLIYQLFIKSIFQHTSPADNTYNPI